MTTATTANPLFDGLRSLHNVKIGGISSNPAKTRSSGKTSRSF